MSISKTSNYNSNANINLNNITVNGKNNLIDIVFDLDYNIENIIPITLYNTMFKAHRSGFLDTVLNNTGSSPVNCYLRTSNTGENSVMSIGSYIQGNTSCGYTIFVPKGYYYFIGCTNTNNVEILRARFIPLKNSIVS